MRVRQDAGPIAKVKRDRFGRTVVFHVQRGWKKSLNKKPSELPEGSVVDQTGQVRSGSLSVSEPGRRAGPRSDGKDDEPLLAAFQAPRPADRKR